MYCTPKTRSGQSCVYTNRFGTIDIYRLYWHHSVSGSCLILRNQTNPNKLQHGCKPQNTTIFDEFEVSVPSIETVETICRNPQSTMAGRFATTQKLGAKRNTDLIASITSIHFGYCNYHFEGAICIQAVCQGAPGADFEAGRAKCSTLEAQLDRPQVPRKKERAKFSPNSHFPLKTFVRCKECYQQC